MKSNTLGKILMYNINNTYMYKTKELVHESSQNAENQCSPQGTEGSNDFSIAIIS